MTDSERTVHGDDEVIDLNDDDDFDTSSSPSEMANDGQISNHVPVSRSDNEVYGNHINSDGTNGGTPVNSTKSTFQNEESSDTDRNAVRTSSFYSKLVSLEYLFTTRQG